MDLVCINWWSKSLFTVWFHWVEVSSIIWISIKDYPLWANLLWQHTFGKHFFKLGNSSLVVTTKGIFLWLTELVWKFVHLLITWRSSGQISFKYFLGKIHSGSWQISFGSHFSFGASLWYLVNFFGSLSRRGIPLLISGQISFGN